jgi:hypothetical protein
VPAKGGRVMQRKRVRARSVETGQDINPLEREAGIGRSFSERHGRQPSLA